MKIAGHLEKAQRMDKVRERLDPIKDFELWFWMSMCGGTHAINAALHHVGATDDGDYFCTQSVDVYLEPAAEGWKHSLRYDCDIIHVGMPRVEAPIPTALQQACDAMLVLEDLRDPCIRGDATITPEVVSAVDNAYLTCLRLTRSIVSI